MASMKLNAFSLTKRNDKLLVAVGLCTTKMEVTVNGFYLIAKTLENN